jgi:NAD(P)H-nitrite reductase large subunit
VTADGSHLPADVFLVAAGIAPSVELARRAGLATARGVLVDERLRTSDERIFAAGDIVEWRDATLGLWPVAVEQAEVAAENAVGGSRAYAGSVPQTMLKVVGVELLSIGAITGPNERVDEDAESLRYRKLVADEDGRVIGAILLGHPEQVPAITAAVRRSLPLDEVARNISGGGA